MSSHYTTEPSPSASVLLHTTAGPIQISLFATQTPLACRNFLQHILDGYYDSTAFHRVVPGFVIQGGDPTGTGEGGESIYEDREFETDAKTGEKVVFGDEVHSRLRFNRRGLVGMAKMGENAYGSQFFITLADVRAQLDGKCTMFGRVEGDGIYNVVRIAEAENVDGTERPIYPFKITGSEVLEMPKGEPWASMKKRERVAKRTAPSNEGIEGKAKKKAKGKKGKALLSFGDEGGDEDMGLAPPSKKAKFNTSLIESTANGENVAPNGHPGSGSDKTRTRPAQPSPLNQSQDSQKQNVPKERTGVGRRSSPGPPSRSPPSRSMSDSKSPQAHRRKPSFHNPVIQLPLKDPESPSRSRSLSRSRSRSGTVSPKVPSKPSTSSLNAEIAALKASMRRTTTSAPEKAVKKSALEQLIPRTSIRGRKRPRPGDNGSGTGMDHDSSALQMLNAFKARLEGAERGGRSGGPGSKVRTRTNGVDGDSERGRSSSKHAVEKEDDAGGEEESLCDLHFIAHCQSCSKWDRPSDPADPHHSHDEDDDDGAAVGPDWMTHALSFEKDRLGKDLQWKKKNEEELVVIDPREKERHIQASSKRDRWKGKGNGKAKQSEVAW